jgi:hypothetical protein
MRTNIRRTFSKTIKGGARRSGNSKLGGKLGRKGMRSSKRSSKLGRKGMRSSGKRSSKRSSGKRSSGKRGSSKLGRKGNKASKRSSSKLGRKGQRGGMNELGSPGKPTTEDLLCGHPPLPPGSTDPIQLTIDQYKLQVKLNPKYKSLSKSALIQRLETGYTFCSSSGERKVISVGSVPYCAGDFVKIIEGKDTHTRTHTGFRALLEKFRPGGGGAGRAPLAAPEPPPPPPPPASAPAPEELGGTALAIKEATPVYYDDALGIVLGGIADLKAKINAEPGQSIIYKRELFNLLEIFIKYKTPGNKDAGSSKMEESRKRLGIDMQNSRSSSCPIEGASQQDDLLRSLSSGDAKDALELTPQQINAWVVVAAQEYTDTYVNMSRRAQGIPGIPGAPEVPVARTYTDEITIIDTLFDHEEFHEDILTLYNLTYQEKDPQVLVGSSGFTKTKHLENIKENYMAYIKYYNDRKATAEAAAELPGNKYLGLEKWPKLYLDILTAIINGEDTAKLLEQLEPILKIKPNAEGLYGDGGATEQPDFANTEKGTEDNFNAVIAAATAAAAAAAASGK